MFWMFDELATPALIVLPPIMTTGLFFLWWGRSLGRALVAGLAGAFAGATLYIVLLIQRTLSIQPDTSNFALAPVGWMFALIPYLPACLLLSLVLYGARVIVRRRMRRTSAARAFD